MSNDPSLSEKKPGEGGGRPIDGTNTNKLTKQQMREQRLARFDTSSSKGTTQKFQLKDPPIATSGVDDSKSIENTSSLPFATKVDPQHTASTSSVGKETLPNIQPSDLSMDAVEKDDFRVAAVLAEKEDADLQAAIRLSMGLPVTSTPTDKVYSAIEPLNASENTADMEMLAAAAMVIAANPTTAIANSPISMAPSVPMRIDQPDTDVVMGSDDRKPAAVSPSRILRSNPSHFSGRVRTWYETASPYNVVEFHDCMWDKGTTTENDQKRWLAQGIHFKDEHDDGKVSSPETQTGTRTNASSLLETIISGPGVWCLTQQHGGPCGVLASIQAELLGILLFGPRVVHPLSMISIDFPDDLSSEFTKATPDMSRQKMRQVLALSMGMILARSSLVPSATLQDDSAGDGKESLQALLPRPEPTIKLILPKNHLWDTTTCLEWQHLEPWNSPNECSGVSEHFLTYTISLNKHSTSGIGSEKTVVKRQKCIDAGREEVDDIDHSCRELAHAAAQFLLETNSLNWFQRPGGVLLMVMSIAASRGIPKLKGEMDDLTAKLTSNFGHCSQELLNLLLTGQAVSNVFDHTLRPSGELVCRGIQSQPTIGYLTQLEAMRYLEVGGYYKSPRLPVWVIGSTSHFSVMFGDSNALKESASDALLERVRRAFKRMEGGAEENGFIQSTQLGDFLKSLDLTTISGHQVQTLAAVMDRYGAGIILWEDLWKKTSRLLTGASLESILDGSEEASGTLTPTTSNTAMTNVSNPNDAPMSDEDLARKLQAEWNNEQQILPGSMLTGAFDSGATGSGTSSQKSMNTAPAETESFGHTFQLYHYNGLRGGHFKAFRVTRLSADEAIGASISLGGSNQASHNAGGFGGELDAVLRTKWPSCKIDWLHGGSPSID